MSRTRTLSHRMTRGQLRRRQAGIDRRRAAAAAPATLGLLTIEKYWALRARNKHLHIFLDGEDVTTRCFVADDRQGYVGQYMLGGNGQRLVDREKGGPLVDVEVGEVHFEEGEPIT